TASSTPASRPTNRTFRASCTNSASSRIRFRRRPRTSPPARPAAVNRGRRFPTPAATKEVRAVRLRNWLSAPTAAAVLLTGPAAPAPKEVPELLKNAKAPAFFRNNLALAYGKALSGRRVFEEALEAFKAAVPEQTADPAAYYFHRAVAEHALAQKKDATASIV